MAKAGPGEAASGQPLPTATPLARGVQAPPIEGIAAWLNSSPLSLEELRGQVVVVDFWTYSCLNCIRTLLEEAGKRVEGIPLTSEESGTLRPGRTTRELYAGYAWAKGGYLGNVAGGAQDKVSQFHAPDHLNEGVVYLDGRWELQREAVRYGGEPGDGAGSVLLRYTGGRANVVLGINGESPVRLEVLLFGKPLLPEQRGEDILVDEEGRTYLLVASPRLYNLVRGPLDTYELTLRTRSPEFLLYTFTFGA